VDLRPESQVGLGLHQADPVRDRLVQTVGRFCFARKGGAVWPRPSLERRHRLFTSRWRG